MMRKLSVKVSLLLLAFTAVILIMATAVWVANVHYHFAMFQQEQPVHDSAAMTDWGGHLELAILQSVLWTLAGALAVTLILSILAARRITAPLIEMKSAAATMAHGKFTARTVVRSGDELGQLGQAINDLAGRLQHQEELRNAMTDNVAHELRTPLAALKSQLAALRDGIWQPTPERLQACCEEIDRLTLLVQDLQELNELEGSGFSLRSQHVDLGVVMTESVAAVQAAFLEKELQLQLRQAQVPLIQGDPNRLKQVVLNLLSNAAKYTPTGARVTVSLEHDRQHIRVAVSNSGTHIEPSDLPYLFERLYRGEKSRSRASGGSGIGLALAKAIVEAHGGEIWAENQPGGVSFIFHLPIPAVSL
ncbi:ATP-binding protein [Paenibacillus filicis]|uniref:histidine kinase n=1 Tax=Paenibacillus filicis TaxID=669464 RepID=A0ABU9DRT7_9BACL